MDCKEFREILDLYIDGELAPERIAAAQAHLSECASCERTEKELLRLRQALKVTVSQHQPPDELASKVRRLSEPLWRGLLPTQHESRVNESGALSKGPSWRKNVTLPLPVFALLLMLVLSLGIWSIRLRAAMTQQLATGIHPPSASSKASAADADFSRFDRGGRAVIYKERR